MTEKEIEYFKKLEKYLKKECAEVSEVLDESVALEKYAQRYGTQQELDGVRETKRDVLKEATKIYTRLDIVEKIINELNIFEN